MRIVAPLLATPLLAVLLLAGPGAGPAAAQQDPRSVVRVLGDGRVLVQPDVALVTFGVESTDVVLGAAQADAATRLQAVVDTLLARGVAREEVRTVRLAVTPIYDPRDSSRLQGYRVTSSVQARLSDLDQVGPTIDAATAAGANRVDGISFQVSDPKPPQDQARTLAFADARAKADQLAGLAGLRIVGVEEIAEAGAAPPTPRAPARTDTAIAPAPAAATPVEPGQQEVRSQVTVTFIMG